VALILANSCNQPDKQGPPFLRHNSEAAQTFLGYSSGGFVRRDLLANIRFHIKRPD